MAVGEGFEPPELSLNGFQDRRLKPLGHPTAWEIKSLYSPENISLKNYFPFFTCVNLFYGST